jgi:uncharacterized protein with NAD-binding domain and iron-sulfur cluster
MSPHAPRQKIAILGGGMAALTAAYELTDQPGWQERYEIAVYQMGWRLGGKGASGRNADAQDRIEEHGLHVWGGFYENAFNLMRRCYGELGRPAGAPLATWQEAFTPQNFVVWEEYVRDRWLHWPVEFPPNDALPGSGQELPSLWEYLRMALEWMYNAVERHLYGRSLQQAQEHLLPGWVEDLLQDVEARFAPPVPVAPLPVAPPAPTLLSRLAHTFLGLAHHLVRTSDADPTTHLSTTHHGILWLLEEFMKWFTHLVAKEMALNDTTRRLWLLLDFAHAAIRGVLTDGVLFHGFDVLDDQDLIQWLRRHGASEQTLSSAPVRGFYGYFFAFENGDPNRPRLAAGAGLRHLVRLLLTYKGAPFWEMLAGMGDAVFAPLYLVLKRRGVQFHFFHRVEQLGLSSDHHSVATIRVSRQVTLKGPEYDPLVMVKDLPCWPSTPRYEQIVEGEQLRQQGIDLECPWSPWHNVEEITLHAGRDFDLVLLGITLGPLKQICAELIAVSPAWKDMVDHLRTTPTIAVQTWFGPKMAAMGWTMPAAVGTAYAQPLDSWADFTHLVGRENWPATATPGALLYFCGAWPESEVIPDFSAHDFPAQEKARAKHVAMQWLQDNAAHVLPAVRPAINPTALDWSDLAAPAGVQGAARFNFQYWRANISPAERYVLSVPGDARYRLRAGQSGFVNLYLAGDWIFTGLGGCIEGAAIAGMMAARAISGKPERILGEPEALSAGAVLAIP